MIKLSTKGRYGTRLMMELALSYDKGPVLLKDVAESQKISLGYLDHIVLFLKAAGLITSLRGVGGGYRLVRNPAEITLDEVISAIEGPFSLVECVESPCVCSRSDNCATREVWQELGEILCKKLETISLFSLADRQREKSKSKAKKNRTGNRKTKK